MRPRISITGSVLQSVSRSDTLSSKARLIYSSKWLPEEVYQAHLMHPCISIRRSIHPSVCQSIDLSVMLQWMYFNKSNKEKVTILRYSHHHTIISSSWGRIVARMGFVSCSYHGDLALLRACVRVLSATMPLPSFIISVCLIPKTWW